jgi:glyoxylase-like metal-dependent hydrolase (beta-lactamase superfamily II)
MQRERVADDIYVFTSDLYAEVTASVVLTSAGAVLVDTLAFPEETRRIQRFVEERLGQKIVYVINTHFHADHTIGTCFFRQAHVVSHGLCRKLLDERGRDSLREAQAVSEHLDGVELVLPDIVFAGHSMTLSLGSKTLQLWHTPGHSPDSIVCYVEEDRVLLAADTLMPLPFFADGSYDDLVRSLRSLRSQPFETIVQGHGEVILRGEIEEKIAADLDYLEKLAERVDRALADGSPLDRINVESCGKSRTLLSGNVQQLHRQNVWSLARQRRMAAGITDPLMGKLQV